MFYLVSPAMATAVVFNICDSLWFTPTPNPPPASPPASPPPSPIWPPAPVRCSPLVCDDGTISHGVQHAACIRNLTVVSSRYENAEAGSISSASLHDLLQSSREHIGPCITRAACLPLFYHNPSAQIPSSVCWISKRIRHTIEWAGRTFCLVGRAGRQERTLYLRPHSAQCDTSGRRKLCDHRRIDSAATQGIIFPRHRVLGS